MPKRSDSNTRERSGLTRRRFVAVGVGAWSAAALSPKSGKMRAGAAGFTPADIDRIEPGYVGPQYYDERERRALLDVVESGSPFRYWGPGNPVKVREFEEAFARHMGTRFALGVTSGTAALDCAITGLDIGPGDEVIVPAYSWWSDYTCVVHAGALPVFADIDESFNLDPADVERKITPRTRAILAVHLLGTPCDMDALMEISERRRVPILEDCAQCVGGSHRGRKLGSIGDVGIYSFQINKMITSGEGGAVVTSNPVIYERAIRFHDMGTARAVFTERLGEAAVEEFAGENFRMNEFTGAVLGAQLTKLDTMIAHCRQHAGAVREGIRDLPGIRLRRLPDPDGDIGYAVYFDAGDRTRRDRCIAELRERNVPAATLTGSILLPIEESVMRKRARHRAWPSFNTPEGKAIQYGPDACRQTLDIFDRFVQVRVGARYTARIDDHIVDSIRAVYSAAV
jgi:8-amino-3,8-dideoxy-alpha-D-manno-octulosonate transaminase